jgi:2,3-bisphosphoglycerate-independent phosphoglycerate mutase
MPNWQAFLDRWPHSAIEASEEFVGLPVGQMGNSQVGHINLGTGQPVMQDLPRIDKSIESGAFFNWPVLLALCARAKEANNTLHLISLVGPGGVHANDRHLVAVAELAARESVARPRPRSSRRPRHTAAFRHRVRA